MATYQEIQKKAGNNPDPVRRDALKSIEKITGRPVILYAVEMNNQNKIMNAPDRGQTISINLNDTHGFYEALRPIKGDSIDVILHSPGGSPDATEAIVKLLRHRFSSVRFIIPAVAKSAATMMAMSGEEIILGEIAELGPTDPQMVINGKQSPAHGILAQFEQAKSELSKNSKSMPAWIPILEQYGPSLISQCETAIKLSNRLVGQWLRIYMFKGDPKAKYKADKISKYLSDKKHMSHGRGIGVTELKAKGAKIFRANEISDELATAIEDLRICIDVTFNTTGALKIFENSGGTGMFVVLQQMILQPGQQMIPQTPPKQN